MEKWSDFSLTGIFSIRISNFPSTFGESLVLCGGGIGKVSFLKDEVVVVQYCVFPSEWLSDKCIVYASGNGVSAFWIKS